MDAQIDVGIDLEIDAQIDVEIDAQFNVESILGVQVMASKAPFEAAAGDGAVLVNLGHLPPLFISLSPLIHVIFTVRLTRINKKFL